MRAASVQCLCFVLLAGCSAAPAEKLVAEVADRVFLNGAIYTVDAERSWAEAVAIKDGRIIFVGENAGAAHHIGDETMVTELRQQMMLPGFHDSHIHIMIGKMADLECSLLRLESVEAVAAQLEQCTALAGIGEEGWILGGGWSEWLWPDANPQKDLLDQLFPDQPVYLESSFGHAAWANSRALAIARIDAATEDPPAGVIERNPATGEPSGTLRESAMLLVKDKVPSMTIDQLADRVRAGMALAHSVGITAVIEPLDGSPFPVGDGSGDARSNPFLVRADL